MNETELIILFRLLCSHFVEIKVYGTCEKLSKENVEIWSTG